MKIRIDGKEHELSFHHAALEEIEEETGVSIFTLAQDQDKLMSAKTIRIVLCATTDLTKEDVEGGLAFKDLPAVGTTIIHAMTKSLGLGLPDEEGEKKKKGKSSTGKSQKK